MKETNDEVTDVETYIAEREKEAEEKGERKPRIRPNVNYTSFVLNEVEDVDLEYTGKNEVLEIKLLDSKGTEIKYGQKIHNNEEYTYEVIKLDEQDKNNIEKDLKNIKWCFWIPGIKGFKKEQAKNFIAKTNKTEHAKDFLSGLTDDTAKMKAVKQHGILYAKKEVIEKEGKKIAVLKVRFSKWLDSYTIKVEAYLSGKKGKGDSVATRLLTVNPEILDAYWLNAAGRKVSKTGYKQDVYLYLKTLGLKGKTIEVQVFDKDKHPNPVPATGTDDLVEWKNNKIKIESRETIKQFKVGDKDRYKEAQKDEAAEADTFIGLYDFSSARIYTLELYIHIANTAALNLKDADPQNQYGRLNLIPREEIINAFFAKTETEKVQADAPEIKDPKTGKRKLAPKTRVPYYKKLNNGVIGQKIQLVAECANLEGKEVTFKIYEKEPLLLEKDKELPVLQNNTEVTEVKATIKDGYAVAEIELRQKSDKDFIKWLTTLKIDGKPEDRKKTYFWVTIQIDDTQIPISKTFLKQNTFEVISTNWHEPVDNPQRNKYNFYGMEKPKSSAFGKVRSQETKYHQGLDIFAIPSTRINASLDGRIIEKRFSSSVGNVVTIEVKRKIEAANRRLASNYEFEFPGVGFKGEKEKGLSFDLDDDSKVYIRHYHLRNVNVKKGDLVKAGQKIGESGVTGNADGTRAPHLHLEILDTIDYTYKLKDKINPAYFVNLQKIDDSLQDDSVKYKYYKDGTKKEVD